MLALFVSLGLSGCRPVFLQRLSVSPLGRVLFQRVDNAESFSNFSTEVRRTSVCRGRGLHAGSEPSRIRRRTKRGCICKTTATSGTVIIWIFDFDVAFTIPAL